MHRHGTAVVNVAMNGIFSVYQGDQGQTTHTHTHTHTQVLTILYSPNIKHGGEFLATWQHLQLIILFNCSYFFKNLFMFEKSVI